MDEEIITFVKERHTLASLREGGGPRSGGRSPRYKRLLQMIGRGTDSVGEGSPLPKKRTVFGKYNLCFPNTSSTTCGGPPSPAGEGLVAAFPYLAKVRFAVLVYAADSFHHSVVPGRLSSKCNTKKCFKRRFPPQAFFRS